MDVDSAGHGPEPRLDLPRHLVQRRAGGEAIDPDVDGRWQAEIEDLGLHVARLEIEEQLGKLLRQHLPQAARVLLRAEAARGFEADQDLAVGRGGGDVVAQHDVVGLRDADIVEHDLDIVADHGADLPLDPAEIDARLLDARSRGGGDVQAQRVAVGRREEVAADHGDGDRRQHDRDAEQRQHEDRMAQRPVKATEIARPKGVEAGIESLVEAPECTGTRCHRLLARMMFVFCARQVVRQHRHQGARQQVRRRDGEQDGERQRHEQESRRAGQQAHGQEDDADAQGRDERRNGDFLRAVEDRLDEVLPHRRVTMDVLQGHRRVVDQDADRQSEPAQGHEVDRVAGHVEQEQRREDADRDRDHHHDGAAPAPEEQQDQQGGEGGRRQPLDHDTLDGAHHEDGLVEQDRELEVARRRDLLQHLLGLGDDVEGRDLAALADRQEHRLAAVDPHQVGLRLVTVTDVGDVPHVDELAAAVAERHRVQQLHRGWAVVGLQEILGPAHAHRAGRQDDVLVVDGAADLVGRHAVRLHAGRV